MTTHLRGLFASLALTSLLVAGCSLDAAVAIGSDADAAPDAAVPRPDAASPLAPDTGGDAPTPSDAAAPPPDTALPPPTSRSYDPPSTRGGRWVRANPMFISGLTPSMGAPPADFVRAYFDDFAATAAHLWQDGAHAQVHAWDAMRPGMPYVTWTLPDGRSQTGGSEVLGGASPAPGRIGYQIGDEPRNMEDLLAIEEGVRALRAADPEALIIINFGVVDDGRGPGEGGLLDRMIAHVVDDELADVLSHDNYSMGRSGYRWLEHFRRVGVDAELPYWRYLSSYAGPGDPFPSESDTRWHAKIGAVYGFTGHSWFVYQIGPAHGSLRTALFERTGDFSSPRRPSFAWAAQQNRELRTLGPVLTQLTSTGVFYRPEVALSAPGGVPAWFPGAGEDPYLAEIAAAGGGLLQDVLIGFFRDDRGERYLVVQNPNHDSGTFPANGDSEASITLTFDFGSAPPTTSGERVERFDLLTGDVSDVPLRDSALELRLPAGEIAVLKYATGRPWAGR